MKKNVTTAFPLFMFAFFLIPLLSFDHSKDSIGNQARWEKLGQRKVNFKVDKDEIGVGRFEGFFNACG